MTQLKKFKTDLLNLMLLYLVLLYIIASLQDRLHHSASDFSFVKRGKWQENLGLLWFLVAVVELLLRLSNLISISLLLICLLYHRNTGTLYTASLLKMFVRMKKDYKQCVLSERIWHGY